MDKSKRTQDMLDPAQGLNEPDYGLDLGTYCSFFSYRYAGEKPVSLFNGSDRSTRGGVASLVWAQPNGKILAGVDAEAGNCMQDPEGVCESPKMKLREKEIVLHGKAYSPEELLRCLVQNVRDTALRALEQDNIPTRIRKLVCGYPARFQTAEIHSLLEVLQSVFQGVTIRLAPEPVLAAIYQRYFTPETDLPLEVFDCGAGTCDISVLLKNPKRDLANPHPFLVKNPDGTRTAGNQIDELTAELILEQLERELPEEERAALSTLRDPLHADHVVLLQKARDVKETLSSRPTADFFMSSMSSRARFFTQIRREDFEAKIRPALQINIDKACEVLERSFSGKPDIEILMVGASCYIPLVKTMLMERFDWLPEERFILRSPERAVALGAALYCSDPGVVESLPTAYAYGVATYLAKEDKTVIHIRIPSGAALPCSSYDLYSTVEDGQDNIRFDLYEVEHGAMRDIIQLSEGKATGFSIVHQFGRKVPKNTPVQLTVTLDENGLLTMQVNDIGATQTPPTIVKAGKASRIIP